MRALALSILALLTAAVPAVAQVSPPPAPVVSGVVVPEITRAQTNATSEAAVAGVQGGSPAPAQPAAPADPHKPEPAK